MCSQRFLTVIFLLLSFLHSISCSPPAGDKKDVKRLKLTDLYPEIQLLILDELDLPDWFSLAETSKEYSAFIADELKRKYLKDRILSIENPFIPIDENVDSLFVHGTGYTTTNDKFAIMHLWAVFKMLRLIGDSITRLSFKCDYNDLDDISPAVSKIGRYINEYCADSLIEFDIENYDEHFLKEMSSPFRRVENVSIRGTFETFDSETLPFEELFPAMRTLSLGILDLTDGFIIDRRFSKLDEIYVDLSRCVGRIQEEHVEALLIKNPQIRSLSFEYGSRSFLKFASEHLPQLESLSIHHHYNLNLTDQSPIVFENVKNFTLIAYAESCIPDNTLFPNLNEFNAYGRDLAEAKLIECVQNMTRNSSSFRKLAVTKYAYTDNDFLHDEQVRTLSEHELQLEDIHLALNGDVADETIIDFLRMNQKTRRILLTRDIPLNSFRNVVNIIRLEFADNWSILEADGEILLEFEF